MFEKVEKPWGWYQVLSQGPDYVTKELFIKPSQKFSLQKHFKREEHWHILEGSGILTLGDTKQIVSPGDHIFVPLEKVHRLEASSSGLLFFELQRGDCDEDDILRLEDDYDRI